MADNAGEPGSWLDSSVFAAMNKTLKGRKLEKDWDVTTPAQDEEHRAINRKADGSLVVRTRFPPEPNGYLHIGHAKSMNMNFSLAFEKLGVPPENRETVFRFDDTNPEAECEEYIDNIREDVAWMGWTPVRTTHASDLFPKLYALAVQLVKQGDCYVCYQNKEKIEECRDIAKAQAQARANNLQPGDEGWPTGNPMSPYRDVSADENLRLFEDMRKGKCDEGECCLRMKMDMSSSNMNMFDQVAYRIKYTAHPHVGKGWCIYPTYDFTHCVQDALEQIDFSICTLEFETRRESYYWLLNALKLFKPCVYEMSRLNIEYVVLSKRRLIKLVDMKYVRGWDDPRMPTIKGLRRRGYTAAALNRFCCDIGVTRNQNFIEYSRMEEIIRQELDPIARRAMAVLRPLKVTLTRVDNGSKGGDGATAAEAWETLKLEVPDFPQKSDSSATHSVTFTETIYIDASDFQEQDDPNYFGLAPNKWVGLKYADGCMRCDGVVKDATTGAVTELKCFLAHLPPSNKRPKGTLQWVPANGVAFEARLYNHIFKEQQVGKDWEEQLNPESEVVIQGAMVDPSILTTSGKFPPKETHFQFERLGVFVVDKDSDSAAGQLVINRTVAIKQAKSKPQDAKTAAQLEAENKRKESQKAALAEKAAKANLNPQQMYKVPPEVEKYSAWDDDGIPTKDAAGQPIPKNQIKKLKAAQVKQKKIYEKAQKGQ